jgi:hypothetical protein
LRILTRRRLWLFAFALITLVVAPAQAVAHPPDQPDHGVNGTTYCTLWAGDTDSAVTSIATNNSEGANASVPGSCALAGGTDIALDSPPEAVERWNRGELDTFGTNATRSVYPSGTELQRSAFLEDAYAAVFAVQPSTRVHVAPGETPQFVAPNGSVLATVDYRVAVPQNETTGERRVRWSLRSHDITETRLLVNGSVVSRGDGSHTPTLPYDLRAPNRPYTFTVEADIAVRVEKRVSTCETSGPDGNCSAWTDTTTIEGDSLTVSDSTSVVGYELDVSGYRGVYPDGDLGLVVYKNRPWLGYTLPAGEVRGAWRFYSARDRGWDALVTSTGKATMWSHSPLHPLHVAAYPFEPGATVSPRANLSLLATYGDRTAPPTLPPNVSLDDRTNPYTASYGVATRIETTEHDFSTVTARGLVRGVTVNAGTEPFADAPIRESNLTLSVLNTTDDSVTVRVRLVDAATRAPIATANSDGYVVVGDERLNTSANGTVRTTVPHTGDGVAARYEPEVWWDSIPGYVGDSDAVSVSSHAFEWFRLLYQFGLPLGVFLTGVFLVDRITGWGVWPLWRGLR